MKNTLRQLTTTIGLSLVILSLFPGTAYSQGALPHPRINLAGTELEDTARLLQACDKALNACHNTLSDRDAIIDIQQRQIIHAQDRIKSLEEAQSGTIYRQVLFFSLGVLLTGTAVYLIK
jgi:hypothetical protein